MALIPKLVADIRSNTAAAQTFQPAAGKEWIWTHCRYFYRLASGGADDWVLIESSNGSTHRKHCGFGPDIATESPYHTWSTAEKTANSELYLQGAHLFTNTWYLRIHCGAADANNWWHIAFFGLEAS